MELNGFSFKSNVYYPRVFILFPHSQSIIQSPSVSNDDVQRKRVYCVGFKIKEKNREQKKEMRKDGSGTNNKNNNQNACFHI